MKACASAVAPGYIARQLIRSGQYQGRTHACAPGYVQANLAIFEHSLAADFQRFCLANPKACPLLAMSAVGDPRLPTLGRDVDVRTDLPLYRIWRQGRIVAEVSDIRDYWRDDHVAFLLGCSNSWEEALLEAGIGLLHRQVRKSAPTFRTTRPATGVGVFQGPLVVSMRSFTPSQAMHAMQITARYPFAHGAPIPVEHPDDLGIRDLNRPEYGDAIAIPANHVPLFWECGVTPQAIVEDVGIDFCITHAPGHMLVTDVQSNALTIF